MNEVPAVSPSTAAAPSAGVRLKQVGLWLLGLWVVAVVVLLLLFSRASRIPALFAGAAVLFLAGAAAYFVGSYLTWRAARRPWRP